MSTFFRDRARGKDLEVRAAFLLRVLTHHKGMAAVPAGLFPDFDLVDTCTGRTVEVKADWGAARTDQYVVEFAFGGEPSGIATTAADDWLFWDGEEFILVSMDGLIDVLRGEHGDNVFRFTGPGDRKPKWVYGIPRSVIRGAGIVIVPVPEFMDITPPGRSCEAPSLAPRSGGAGSRGQR